MIKKSGKLFLFLAIVLTTSCADSEKIKLADNNATENTKALYIRITNLTRQGFMVGHQDATAYGVGWKWAKDSTTSDIQMVCGENPSIYGWEIGGIENDQRQNLDSVDFSLMKQLIQEAHARGGISTISWHADDPVTGESAWTKKATVKTILSDPAVKAKYIVWLGKVSEFLTSLKDEKGQAIPVIFRPWHEWTGDWFWWGTPHSSNKEFISFWTLTVETMRDKYNVHNVLYAFSSGEIKNKEEFMDKYPGNDYVDILGFDIYVYNDDIPSYRSMLRENLRMFAEMAMAEKKLFAVTETGYESIPSENWFSESVYPLVKESGASWVLFWRNANKKHHYAPFPGDVSSEDFRTFHSFPETLFEGDIAKIK